MFSILPPGHPAHGYFIQGEGAGEGVRAEPEAFLEALADLAIDTNDKVDQSGDYSLYAPLLPHARAAAEIAEAQCPAPSVGAEGAPPAVGAEGALPAVGAKGSSPVAGADSHPPLQATAARLWNELGYHLHALADYAGARGAYERALRIDEAAFGPDHPNVAIRVNNLGSVLEDMGDLAGARAAYERALRILEKAGLPPDHPYIRIVRDNLARLG